MAKVSNFIAIRQRLFTGSSSWPLGEPILASEEWLDEQKRCGNLPDVSYRWSSPHQASSREAAGTYTVVMFLDADTKTRHEVHHRNPGANVLSAKKSEWDEALIRLRTDTEGSRGDERGGFLHLFVDRGKKKGHR